MVKTAEKKQQMQLEADKLLLSSVEQIELSIHKKFEQASKELDDRLYLLL